MPCRSSLPVRETADAASRVLAAVRGGCKPEIEQELQIAAQVCGQPFDGDTAEDERREVLEGVVERLRRVLASGEPVSGESRSLVGCMMLLEHLGISGPRRFLSAAASCRHRALPTVH